MQWLLLSFFSATATQPAYTPYYNFDISPCTLPCARLASCGYGFPTPCDPATLFALCDSTFGCTVINSNAWAKGCGNASCGASFEPSPNTTTFIKHNGAWPPAPVAPVEDEWYPPEQPAEATLLAAELPSLLAAGGAGARAWAFLQPPRGPPINLTIGASSSGFELVAAGGGGGGAQPTATVERVFSRWAALSQLQPNGGATHLRRSVGTAVGLTQPSFSALRSDQPSYYALAAFEPGDYLGARILNDSGGEPCFLTAAKYLAPQRDYAPVGAVAARDKFSISPDGRIKRADGAIYTPGAARNATQPGALRFDPADFVPWPATNWSSLRSGLVGGYLRVVATAGFDAATGLGFEQIAFAEAASGAVLVRLRPVNASAAAQAGAPLFFNVSARSDGGEPPQPLGDAGAAFYAALFAEQRAWRATLAGAALVTLPGQDGARTVDALWGSLVAALSLYVGLEPNYGNGGYWAPNSSLTSEVAPLNLALVELGLAGMAGARLGYYFDAFVGADGSLPECAPCADGTTASGGFGDALADYGEMLDVFSRVGRAMLAYEAGGQAWVAAHVPQFARLAGYALRLRLNATQNGTAPGTPTAGLVWGSPEHDTCHEPGYYFHNSAWLARGLLEAGRFLRDAGGAPFAALAAQLLAEAGRFRADIANAVALAAAYDAAGPVWVPPLAVPGGRLPPFQSMTESILASYTNFRYAAELVSADILAPSFARAVLDFRATHGGTVSGLTRYLAHLDDMASAGYAWAHLWQGRVDRFLLLTTGHAANYAARGTFSATEQVPFETDSEGLWRDYLWSYLEGGIDACVPSLLFPAQTTRWALLLEHWDYDAVWVARGAPRRWYAGGFALRDAPTRFGTVSYSVAAAASSAVTDVAVSFAPPPYEQLGGRSDLVFELRLRALTAGCALANATIYGAASAKITGVDAAEEVVTVTLQRLETTAVSFNVSAAFTC